MSADARLLRLVQLSREAESLYWNDNPSSQASAAADALLGELSALYRKHEAEIAAQAKRHVQVALGRINEVRVRLRSPPGGHEGMLCWHGETVAEFRTSLLDAMTQLQSLLPAECAAEWGAKRSRQP